MEGGGCGDEGRFEGFHGWMHLMVGLRNSRRVLETVQAAIAIQWGQGAETQRSFCEVLRVVTIWAGGPQVPNSGPNKNW